VLPRDAARESPARRRLAALQAAFIAPPAVAAGPIEIAAAGT